tara:strand:- start:242 stop:817 length:576 start_codon:yes stop_codon:yes gene_type:complete
MYLNAPSYVFTSDTEVTDIKVVLSYFETHKTFKTIRYFFTNNNITPLNYILAESGVIKNTIDILEKEKKKLTKIDLFMLIQQLKYKIPNYVNVIGCYILFYKENFKELLLHHSTIEELPEWLIDDMKNWLKDKKSCFDVAIQMIKEYNIDYFSKDESKTLSNQWDKGMKINLQNRIDKQKTFIKWCFENYV